MKPSEIGKAYDRITGLWQSDTFDVQNGIDPHKRAIAFVNEPGLALDVGCGCSGRFIDLLLDSGFSPQGVDISQGMIALARKRHPQVEFHHQDICVWHPPNHYRLITAWDSIWHVPLSQQEPVLAKLVGCLDSGGVLIFSCGGTDEPGDHKDDFMGPEVYYASLGINGFINLLIKLGCFVRHVEYDQYPQSHAYLIVQKA